MSGKPPVSTEKPDHILQFFACAHLPADLRAVSQWYTHLLEQAIRRAPPQYRWVHRRWRGQPPQATVGRSAA